MNYNEAVTLLEQKGQSQLLAHYESLADEEKAELLRQIEEIDFGILAYLNKGNSHGARGNLEPLDAMELSEIEAKRELFLKTGLKAVREGKIGAVMLAGGQGTRLGFDKAKGMLNIGITRELYIFECLIRNLQEVTEAAGAAIPLYIMTSEKNHDETLSFFREYRFFGYPEEYVCFFKQEMVPATDFEGKIYLEERGRVSLSPNGNGGWFSSMKRTGILEDIHTRGLEWLNVFSVDNVLQRIADPVFAGAVIETGCVSGAKVVRKAAPEERVGVLCLEDGRPSIVEYYEMTDEMVSRRKDNGDLAYNFGVTLNYLFHVEELEQTMNRYMPVHVVRKKIPFVDNAGNVMEPEAENGYKFETLVLDMVHLMKNCLPVEVARDQEFAPIKNRTGVDSPDTARELLVRCGVAL